ncbi:MAG: GNAT family N-acetyltransferase [Opitutae bacterium]|nr:GNAT family N-acetyltransferase [Opitutae bacterium]
MSGASSHDQPGTFLPWDTDFFGFRVGRANATTLTRTSLDEVLQWCRAERIRCLYFAADREAPETLALAATGGFQFVDVRLDLSLSLGNRPALPAAGPSIRPAQPDDIPPLAALARHSHRDSRFFKDPGFPSSQAEELYAEWIRRDYRQHTVLTAGGGLPAAPSGYVTCQVSGGQRGRIGLIAVAPAQQGRGLGRALVNAALQWFHSAKCTEVRVATQASNVAAQRLYQAAGFRTAESSVWFHRWFPSSV